MRDLNSRAFWLLLSALDSELHNEKELEQNLEENAEALDAAITLAKPNGLYFPFMKWLIRKRIKVPSKEDKSWASELQSMSEFKNTIGVLNEILQNAGLEYILIKNGNIIEHVPRDVDILVHEQDRDQLIDLFRANGLKLLYNGWSETSLVKAGLMRIDIYTRIHYIGMNFLDENYLWESCKINSEHGMTYPSLTLEADYLLNSIHGLLGHQGITLLDFLNLSSLERRLSNLVGCRNQAVISGWGNVFDLWTDRLQMLRSKIYEQHLPIKFPLKHDRRFILRCVSALDRRTLRRRERLVFGLSLLWGDLVFLSENSRIANTLRQYRIATKVMNSIGHRLMSIRGDMKSLSPVLKEKSEHNRNSEAAEKRNN